MSDLMREGSALAMPADGAYGLSPATFEHSVRAFVTDCVATAEREPLIPGDRIAWTLTTVNGKTDGLSALHRVRDQLRTMCEEEIPPAVRRIPGNQRSLEGLSLPLCRACIVHALAEQSRAS